jgi:hypothetical protein
LKQRSQAGCHRATKFVRNCKFLLLTAAGGEGAERRRNWGDTAEARGT